MYYFDPTIQILQSDELLFWLFCLIFWGLTNFLKTQVFIFEFDRSMNLLLFRMFRSDSITFSNKAITPTAFLYFKVFHSESRVTILAHLVYQPKSLVQSCFVCRASSSLLASAPGLDIEASYLVYISWSQFEHVCKYSGIKFLMCVRWVVSVRWQIDFEQ